MSIQLSIILTTHAPEVHFEPLLRQLLAVSSPHVEIIIINDASHSKTAEFILAEIENAQNERVFLFEHEQPTGRGQCLNEALVQASGSFIWAPVRADRFNASLMLECLYRFKSDPAAFWALDYNLPDSVPDWLEAAHQGELPDDSCLIWNRSVIEPSSFVFNPFMNTLHGAELAMRLQQKNAWHTTDPFFVVADDQSQIAQQADLIELLQTAYRIHQQPEIRENILKMQSGLNSMIENSASESDDFLLQARQLLEQGDAKRALEQINRFLKTNPNHQEANRLKIHTLEKLRRHVEAAELKHDLQKLSSGPITQAELFREKSNPKTSQPSIPEIELSVVIPTTAMGKPMLEKSLLHLEGLLDPDTTELIVIDNASVDDTFEYLQQLDQKKFLNIKIITNSSNKGFGASVNQGLDLAKGDYVLILHNDVVPHEDCILHLKEAVNTAGNIGLAAPVLIPTENSDQKKSEETNGQLLETDFAESCCFMVPGKLPVRFDEEYHLCHFEMEDFCKQLSDSGFKIKIVPQATTDHNSSGTLLQMGIKLAPWLKWQNRKRFAHKWSMVPDYAIPEQGSHPDKFERLGPPENPVEPEPEWVSLVTNYLTSEVRTEILRKDWSEQQLITIVSTLLIADERELLRTLEDRLDNMEIPTPLLVLFVYYYFNKNIYSRCKHYLEKAKNSHPLFDLFRLKIMVADKELDDAAKLLNKLLKQFPASPDIYNLAGEIYRQQGEEDEAKSFFALAYQLDPFRFTNDEAAFEIKY